MASRFPGIDPYVESRGLWPGFYRSFLVYCSNALNDRLPEDYYTLIDERVVPDDPSGQSLPGVLVAESVEIYLQIFHLPDRTRVSVLELLTPENKREPVRSAYLDHREAILRQSEHLVELDFLIGGRRLPGSRPLPPGDCYALVSRADRRRDCEVYAWSIRRPLPKVPVPLLAPDPDVWLDLAELFATAYERGRYARLIDYQAPLPLPLAPEDRAWAEELARASAR